LGPLIEEFKQAPQSENLGLKWIIGAALNKIADASVFEEMKDIVLDSSNGKSRELVVSALGNIKSPESQRLLLQLLSDEQLCGFAIMGLSKVADLGVRKSIIPFLSHPKTWIRKEAEKAIRRIDRSSNSETLS
jgi:HEAT repeat protein